MSRNLYQGKLKHLVKSRRIKFNDSSLYELLENSGGLYRITLNSAPQKTLYIGKAKNIKQRLYSNLLMGQIRSHTLKRKFIRAGKCSNQVTAKDYLKKNCAFQYIREDNRRERTFYEHYFIAMLRPEFND